MSPTKENAGIQCVSNAKVKEKSDFSSILVHDSFGLKFYDGPPKPNINSSNFQNIETKVKFVTVSQNGNLLAWIANGEVCVVEFPLWKRIGTLQHPKAMEVSFSPKGNLLAVYDIFTQSAGSSPSPNLSIYDVHGRKLLKTFVQKKHDGWQPQWTKDETVMARSVAGEVHFYEGKELDSYKHKKAMAKLRSFSFSLSVNHHHVAFFVPSQKDAPAIVKLYKYPNFKDSDTPIATKSFFKVETVEYFWNSLCSAVLILTTGELDKTGGSYYGEQMLFFMNTRGDSNRITFSKQGNIRSVAWCPSGKEFFCVYGFAPAKGTLFDTKCNPIGEFGDGARNLVLVNPQGNLVLLGGLGNISSRFEIWDVKERKQLGKVECPDITHMEWSPCGQHILTATCSPRLRVNNGYKLWHYTCVLLHEKMYGEGEEMMKATFLPREDVKPFEVSNKPVKGIQSQVKKASTQKYVPPSQRTSASLVGRSIDTSKKFLSQIDKPVDEPEDAKKKEMKEKKKQAKKEKKEEAKKKKEEEKGMDKDWREEREKKEGQETRKDNPAKRRKNIKKKLESIEKLKQERDEGKVLDSGQLEKIATEAELLKELEELTVT